MRRKIKKPLTERAKELAVKKLVGLARMPDGVIDADMAVGILEQSVLNSWQGLFPLKEENRGKNIADMWRNL